ncbi:MAG TPA: leucine-rich repeat domain-containing protein, partial [Campylobacterales bacterium]|nr:leucine-rich repeat domain-containing protein [Campylobacterales bacterium]
MITDKEIQKIVEWADEKKVVGKSWKKAKWGSNLFGDDIYSVKKGIPRDKETLLKITHLNLSKAKLSNIPLELYKLTQLQDLDISNNSISTLSKEIGNLINLEYLNLSENRVLSKKNGYYDFSITSEIKNLKKIKVLNLSNLDLKVIPQEIWKIESLTNLGLELGSEGII